MHCTYALHIRVPAVSQCSGNRNLQLRSVSSTTCSHSRRQYNLVQQFSHFAISLRHCALAAGETEDLREHIGVKMDMCSARKWCSVRINGLMPLHVRCRDVVDQSWCPAWATCGSALSGSWNSQAAFHAGCAPNAWYVFIWDFIAQNTIKLPCMLCWDEFCTLDARHRHPVLATRQSLCRPMPRRKQVRCVYREPRSVVRVVVHPCHQAHVKSLTPVPVPAQPCKAPRAPSSAGRHSCVCAPAVVLAARQAAVAGVVEAEAAVAAAAAAAAATSRAASWPWWRCTWQHWRHTQ
jgi:hypothetical protein